MRRKKIPFVKLSLLVLAALLLFAFAACRKDRNSAGNEVVIWTYDSFNSEWGPGPDVRKFLKKRQG